MSEPFYYYIGRVFFIPDSWNFVQGFECRKYENADSLCKDWIRTHQQGYERELDYTVEEIEIDFDD